MRFTLPSRRRGAGFTLIELIVVITIIGIISVFVVPAASTMIMGTDLTRSAQVLSSQLSIARQIATTKNHAVEVRFIQFADPEQPGEKVADPTTWRFRAIQLMEVFENGNMAQVGKFERLLGNVIMDESLYSSLLDQQGTAQPNQQPLKLIRVEAGERVDYPPLPRTSVKSPQDALKYHYVAFRFLTDGTTNLNPNGNWFVTLYQGVDRNKLQSGGDSTKPPPFNYFTAQIDAANGSVRSFRPTAGTAQTGGTTGH